MPELPDVERYRRTVQAVGLHRKIAGVSVSDPRILDGLAPRELDKRLAGLRFTATRRHGKHLLIRHDGDGWLTMHFGMTGAIAAVSKGADPPPYTRIRLDFADGDGLAYTSRRMLGRVGLADDAEAFVRAHGLGPDALDPALDASAFAALLGTARRSAKAALMDQSVIAGIGNIYSDEILFQARLHPGARLDRLDQSAIARLHRSMRRVLEVAIERDAGSEEFLDCLPRGYLLPRRGKGGTCPRCGASLANLKAGGRTAWLCPDCQPRPQ